MWVKAMAAQVEYGDVGATVGKRKISLRLIWFQGTRDHADACLLISQQKQKQIFVTVMLLGHMVMCQVNTALGLA